MPRPKSRLPHILVGTAGWATPRQHAALFAGFTRGAHRYFATGHNIHREDPAAVADAIRDVAAITPER